MEKSMTTDTISKTAVQVQAAMHCPDTHLRIETIQVLTGRGRAWVYARAAAGEFPKPVIRGRWRAGDVLNWLSAQRGG